MSTRLSASAFARLFMPAALLLAAAPARAQSLDPIQAFQPPWLDAATPSVSAAPAARAAPVRYRDDMTCLAAAIAYEAGNQSDAGQQAVAEVVLNRLKSGHYGASVCAVVFQGAWRRTGCQFSFTCDGSLSRALEPGAWAVARAVAGRALAGRAIDRTDGATHYHTATVTPFWRTGLHAVGRIGAHLFYRPARAGEQPERPASPTSAGSVRPVPSGPWGLRLTAAN